MMTLEPPAPHGVGAWHPEDRDVVMQRVARELRPGGLHMMFFDLKAPLKAGESFPVTLRFEKAGEVQVTVSVEAMGATGAGGHDMQHGHGMPQGHDAQQGHGMQQGQGSGTGHGMQHGAPGGQR